MRSEVCGSRNHDVAIKSAILIFFNGGGYNIQVAGCRLNCTLAWLLRMTDELYSGFQIVGEFDFRVHSKPSPLGRLHRD